MSLQISFAGPMSTIQDLGRMDHRANGFGTNGAMDKWTLLTLNRLLGNQDNDACLEMTLFGVTGTFTEKAYFAYGGGEFAPTLNDTVLQPWTVYVANPGDELTFGACKSGLRGYLCVAGGFTVPVVLGSRSTNVKCGIGGFEGRKLMAGDELPTVHKHVWPWKVGKHAQAPFAIAHEQTVRVILGPQDDAFTEKGKETFLLSPYTMTPYSDRMGARFEGEAIESVAGVDILSDGIVPGAIQIPKEGKPIVLLSDCQTTGGYAKIGCVIDADLSKFAQLRPGDVVRFVACTFEEARRARRDMMAALPKKGLF